MASRQDKRLHRFATGAVTLLLAAVLVGDGATVLPDSTAHADQELSEEEEQAIHESAWGTYAWSTPIEGYEEIPLAVATGYPMADVRLGTPAPKCEARAAGTWLSYEVEEAIIPAYWPGEGESSPEDPGSSTYRHPSLARAANPPYQSQYGPAEENAEMTYAGGDTAGPIFKAACPSPLAGHAMARHFKLASEGLRADQGAADASQAFEPMAKLIVTELDNKLTNVEVGGMRLKEIHSFLRVELPPDAEPKITYRMVLSGLSEGKNAGTEGAHAIVLAGQDVSNDQLVNQFNEQVKAHEGAFEQMGRYGLRIMAPNIEEGRCWGRGSKTTGCHGWYLVEGPVLDAGFGPAARKDNIGQYQALRLGSTRFFGSYKHIGQAADGGEGFEELKG